MSAIKIRAALEVALNAMSPSLSTAWENQAFTPPAATVAFQVVHIMNAQPSHAECGRNYQQLGYMQVRLMYPLQIGSSTATTRAELLRTTFYRGATFTASPVNVLITDTPEIMPGQVEDGRYAVVVRIRFRANIP